MSDPATPPEATAVSPAPDTTDDLCEQFDEKCVLAALSEARDLADDDGESPTVSLLDEETGRIYRVLDATRGSPDSGWFVLALAGSHPDDGYERQLRIHDSDTHCVLVDDADSGDRLEDTE